MPGDFVIFTLIYCNIGAVFGILEFLSPYEMRSGLGRSSPTLNILFNLFLWPIPFFFANPAYLAAKIIKIAFVFLVNYLVVGFLIVALEKWCGFDISIILTYIIMIFLN